MSNHIFEMHKKKLDRELANLRKQIAEDFYEQCAGTFEDVGGSTPNNPSIFNRILVAFASDEPKYAATKTEFAQLLRTIANELDGKG